MERWRYQECFELEPGLAMGLDDLALEEGADVPLLRFYTWKPAALSLGYFQRRAEVAAIAQAAAVVRRATGGGAIHHASELTFAIALPREHALYRGPVADSYRRIHLALAAALARLGLCAELCGNRRLLSDRPGTGMCFHASTPLDLVWGERKGIGSAQRRTRARILHHGSIKLSPDALEPGVATLADCGRELGPAELADFLRGDLGRRLALELVRADPQGEELSKAAQRARRFVEAGQKDLR